MSASRVRIALTARRSGSPGSAPTDQRFSDSGNQKFFSQIPLVSAVIEFAKNLQPVNTVLALEQ